MHLFVYDFAIQYLEGIQMDALLEGKDGVADGGVVGQSQVLLRGPRGRGGMRVPVGENLQACEIRLTRYSAGLQQVTWWIKKKRQPNFSDCRPKSG